MEKLCTNKNHSYKHNEQINKQHIDNSKCFGVTFVKIYPEMTSYYFFEKIWFWLIIYGFFTFPHTFDRYITCTMYISFP